MVQQHDFYFMHIASRLNDNDLKLLQILKDNQATASFKAMKKQQLQQLSQMSDALFRKSLSRLHSILYVETVVGSKEHSLFITTYGQMALSRAKAV